MDRTKNVRDRREINKYIHDWLEGHSGCDQSGYPRYLSIYGLRGRLLLAYPDGAAADWACFAVLKFPCGLHQAKRQVIEAMAADMATLPDGPTVPRWLIYDRRATGWNNLIEATLVSAAGPWSPPCSCRGKWRDRLIVAGDQVHARPIKIPKGTLWIRDEEEDTSSKTDQPATV